MRGVISRGKATFSLDANLRHVMNQRRRLAISLPVTENWTREAQMAHFVANRCHTPYPTAATIREYLPRFPLLSDQEILRAAFRLADAQELVARKEGFEGWQALTHPRPANSHFGGRTPVRSRPQGIHRILH